MGKIREAIRGDEELYRRIRVIADNPPPAVFGKDYNELLVRKVEIAKRNRERGQMRKDGR